MQGDEDALERAVANLVENARLYGPDGGRIRVTVAEPRRQRGACQCRTREPACRRPMPTRAVERFWRGGHTRARPGSGLGLSIVRSTADRHGGSLVIDGPRFTLRLPAA